MGEEKSLPNQNSEDKNSELKKETNSQHFPEDSHAPKQATETMEVHHHGHVHEKKKWKEYLFQFLMLFLAVFCGFLAENQREHMIEHNREKQFVTSLINDLRLDSASLDRVTNSAKSRIRNIDSAILFLSESQTNEIPVSIYQYLQKSTIQVMFFSNNGTITQLKSSGAMRLIRNRAAVDSIQAYDLQVRRLEVRRDVANQLTHDFTEALTKTVSGNDVLDALYDSVFYMKKIVQRQTIKLSNQNLNELINKSISIRLRAVSDTTANFFVKEKALRLVDFLKKEYHME